MAAIQNSSIDRLWLLLEAAALTQLMIAAESSSIDSFWQPLEALALTAFDGHMKQQ